MQPCSREMQAMSAIINQSQMCTQDFDPSSLNEDFFEQMLSTLPPSSWPDLTMATAIGTHKSGDVAASGDQEQYDTQRQFLLDHDQSAALASKLRQHQISSGEGTSVSAADMKSLLLQQQLLLESRGLGGGGLHFPVGDPGTVDSCLSPMPHSLGNGHGVVNASSFTPPNSGIDDSVQALYNVFAGSLSGQASDQAQHLQHTQDGGMQAQSFGAPAASGSAGGGGAAAQPRQRVRARRGQATDPHSIAERLRRERIAERMKALQELVPNANKTDKASMLDEIIDYVKFLQLQVKVLSMSRLGGAAAVAPLVADVASEGTGDRTQTRANGGPTASTSNPNDSITVTEHQVAKLMEEDMGSAMQYLQGKGLCLMPISLAAAISTATGRNPIAGAGPSSPSISGLTVQSTTLVNGGGDASV